MHSKSGISESFDGHFGPVTGLHCNHVAGPIDFSHLFLSSSFDWSVKLWNIKEPGKSMYSFEHNSDYVYDVAWSPVHPAVYACVDGSGRLDLWNLINDTELPSASITVDGSPALNKLRWSHNGLQIAVGDDQGKISMFDVSELYGQVRADDWQKFVRVLQDLKENTNELDDNGSATSSSPSVMNSTMAAQQQQQQQQQSGTQRFANEMPVKREPHETPIKSEILSPAAGISLMSQFKSSPNTPK
jgi:dynein intermediate chain